MTSKVIKMVIEYDGTNYYGWQRQAKVRSVQGEIERVLKKIFKVDIEIHGSGRTDAGVHAYGQTATFTHAITMPLKNLKIALNNYLSEDVRIIALSIEEDSFHARYSAKGKTYIYKVNNRKERDVFLSNYSYCYPYALNDAKIKAASKFLLGEHDFISFMASGSSVVNTRRTITNIDIKREGELVTFTFTGNGFLYKMVRILAALLLEVGNERLPVNVATLIFSNPTRKYTTKVAPAQGLYLNEVYY